jgi:tetratricopeptide (TPR) repeat protein
MKPLVLLCSVLCSAAVAPPAARLSADERIALYEKQLKAAPNDPKVEGALASAFIQKLRETTDFQYLNRAAILVERILAGDPRSYDGIRLSAEIETHRHNFPKAAQLARDLTARNPSDAGAWGLLGDSLMEMGQYDAANGAYQRMLALGPNLASYNRVAWHRFVTGNGVEALSWMSTAVAAGIPINENLAWCLVEFGDMLFKSGRTDDAHAAYEKALATLPGYHRALAALGREYAAAGEFEKAVENFRKAQAVIPLPDYAHALAILYGRLGRASEAGQQRKLIDVIDKLGQANGEKGNRMLAMNFADENRSLERAVELARAELENRKDVYTYDALSWVLFRSGRQQEAEEASLKALAMRTPEPMFLYHAGVIALAGGKADAGRDLLERALALNPSFSWPQADDARMRLASGTRGQSRILDAPGSATITQVVIH